MKKQVVKEILACACAALAVLVARAAVDCGTTHPNGCEHKTTQGTQACATDAATCDGASQTNCVNVTGKEVKQFDKVIDDGSVQGNCVIGSTTNQVVAWTGHHYISNTSSNCSRTFGCMWQTEPAPAKCVTNPATYSGWAQADWPKSNDCL